MIRCAKFLIPALLTVLLTLSISSSFAQDAADPLAGTTPEMLGSISPSAADGQTLVFMRITMEPGASIPPHSHPGAVVLVVQSGLFGTEFVEGEGQIVRFGQEGNETLVAGSETTMSAGDSLSYEGAVHTMRNDGPEPLVLLVSGLLDPAQPGFLFR